MLFFGDASQVVTPGPIHLLLVLALLWWVCPRWIKPRVSTRIRPLISLMIIWVWVFSTPAIANLALRQLEGQHGEQAVTPEQPGRYVVLGAGTPARVSADAIAQLDLAGWRRLEAAVGHWQKSGGTLLLVGGLSNVESPTTTSLARRMHTLARQWGVPEHAIIMAGHRSQNTREDMAAAADLLSISGQPDSDRTYLVTSAGHMPRSLGVAKALGMTLTPMPTDWRQLNDPSWRAWFPNSGGPAFWRLSLYELLGTMVYRWRGWL